METRLHSRPRIQLRFGAIELLEFADEDMRTLFDLRNHPSVRIHMPDPAPLDYEAHRIWVQHNLLAGTEIRILIARQRGEPVGFTVLKNAGAECLELGVIFAAAKRLPGVPAQVAVAMMHLCFEHLGANRVITYVNPHHERAVALNQGLGEETASAKPNEICFQALKQSMRSNARYRRLLARVARTLHITTLAQEGPPEPPAA